MDVTATDISTIPAGNVRVARSDFAALWTAAERRLGQCPSDWSAAGVAVTCRWLAGAIVRPATGPAYPARSPVSRRTASAYPELIEAECLAAEKLVFRTPVPAWLQNQPGWSTAILATLNWAWRREGCAPIDIAQVAVS
jgi:hypothetical protein